MLTFNLHIGDWWKSTVHLSDAERGIYLSLLLRYYDTEQPLPADRAAVYRLACARNADAMLAVDSIIDEFFVLQDDGWHNKRADEEIAEYRAKSEKAKRSAEVRWNNGRTTTAQRTVCDGNANAQRTHSEGNANHEPRTTNQDKTPVAPKGARRAPSAKVLDPLVLSLFEQDFWPAYPRKEAKPKALEAFAKALPKAADGCREILHGLERAKRSDQWLRNGGQYIPHASTWLNQERWRDEHPQAAPQRATPHTGLRTGDNRQPLRGHDGSDLLDDQGGGDEPAGT